MSPEAKGYDDALRGITSCPFGLPDVCQEWAKGHDRAVDNGLGRLPRFGRIARKRR